MRSKYGFSGVLLFSLRGEDGPFTFFVSSGVSAGCERGAGMLLFVGGAGAASLCEDAACIEDEGSILF
jgi:hypothetical protein